MLVKGKCRAIPVSYERNLQHIHPNFVRFLLFNIDNKEMSTFPLCILLSVKYRMTSYTLFPTICQ